MTQDKQDKPAVTGPKQGKGKAGKRPKEPIGDVSETDLTSAETYELATGIEAQRDA